MIAKISGADGKRIVGVLIRAVQENKQYLSDIDGRIGDGDHGINMNKGFTQCRDELDRSPGDLSHCLRILSNVLLHSIGGSMGPLYGMFFRGMSNACAGSAVIDAQVFAAMLAGARDGIAGVSTATVGDKTLLDTLVPAIEAFKASVAHGADFIGSLESMKVAAAEGRDSTEGMIAKVGRSSRLGERSRGVLDAGAVSCCIILTALADAIAGSGEDDSPRRG